MTNRWVNNGNSDRVFVWAPESLQMVTATMVQSPKRCQSRQYIKKQRHYLANKGHSTQNCFFQEPHMDVRIGPHINPFVNAEELMLLHCGVGEDS